MTEQQMPARIWVRSCGGGVSLPSGATYVTVVGENRDVGRGVAFVRSDIAERMAEALEESRLQIEYMQSKFEPTGSGNAVLARIRSALSAFKDSAKDGGAS